MKKAFILSGLCFFIAGVALAQRTAAPQPTTVTLENCRVDLVKIGDAKLAAQEAGVIAEINVRDGEQVPAGKLLVKIDDAQPRMQKLAAAAERDAAQAKYENDVEIRHATAAAEVAKFEFLRSQDANKAAPGSISQVEMKEKEFAWKKALLAIEQTQKEQKLNGFTAQGKQAEVDNADEAIKRREVRSTFDGVVQSVSPHVGEWVKPGDAIIRLMRMDRLRVKAT